MRQNTTLKVMNAFKTSSWQPRGSLMLRKAKFKSPLVCAFVLHSAVVGRFLILWNTFKGLTSCFRTMSRKFLRTNSKLHLKNKFRIKQDIFFLGGPLWCPLIPISPVTVEPLLEPRDSVLISLLGLFICRFQVLSMPMCDLSRQLRFPSQSKIMHFRGKEKKKWEIWEMELLTFDPPWIQQRINCVHSLPRGFPFSCNITCCDSSSAFLPCVFTPSSPSKTLPQKQSIRTWYAR